AVGVRWQSGCAAIGEVTDSGRLRVLTGEDVVGDVPISALVDGCPLYDLEPEDPGEWIYPTGGAGLDDDDADEVMLSLLGSPNVASARWAFQQYDSIVGSRTARRPESADAAVLAIDEAGSAIA